MRNKLPAHIQPGTWQERYLKRFYFDVPDWKNGTDFFHELCLAYILPGSRVLEVGAGPDNPTSAYLASICGELSGLDIDPAVVHNRHIKRSHVYAAGGPFPLGSSSFDAVVSNYTNEHVADPLEFLKEIRRILRPGGVFIFRTPNLFHYVGLFAALAPRRAQLFLANRLRNLDSRAHEPYPVHYRMNTPRRLGRLCEQTGFSMERMDMVEFEPSYGLKTKLLFFPMMAYERWVNRSKLWKNFRANIFGILRKPFS